MLFNEFNFSHRLISCPECVQNVPTKVDSKNGNKFRTILKLLFFLFTLTSKRIFTLFFLLGIFIGNFYICHCLFLNTESRPRYSQQFSRVHLNWMDTPIQPSQYVLGWCVSTFSISIKTLKLKNISINLKILLTWMFLKLV